MTLLLPFGPCRGFRIPASHAAKERWSEALESPRHQSHGENHRWCKSCRPCWWVGLSGTRLCTSIPALELMDVSMEPSSSRSPWRYWLGFGGAGLWSLLCLPQKRPGQRATLRLGSLCPRCSRSFEGAWVLRAATPRGVNLGTPPPLTAKLHFFQKSKNVSFALQIFVLGHVLWPWMLFARRKLRLRAVAGSCTGSQG